MIISELNGGLGNQLFQFAIARNLSLKLNIPFKLDVSIYNSSNNLRQYHLSVFGFKNTLADHTDISFFFPNRANGIARILQTLKKTYYRPVVIKEQNFKFNADILGYTNNNIYLKGYWQSEKYFSDIRSTLLDDLKITVPLRKSNRVLLEKMQSKKSVALHIRRGDYLGIQHQFPIMDAAYYQNAINKIYDNNDYQYFIFSDDIAWCKEVFGESDSIYYSEGNSHYVDLCLMTMCNHNIIGNSTFGWWGSWLNNNPNKKVVVPKQWFGPALGHLDTKDMTPKEWIKI
jgi:hypothetical protein